MFWLLIDVANKAKMKILVIEDELKLAEYIRRALSEHGHVVDVAVDGAEGLYLVNEIQYDVILLDVTLPGIDGFQVLDKLRRRDQVPVIMLTARDKVEDRVRGLEAGADDYLVKPFALSELVARILVLARRGNRSDVDGAVQNTLHVGDLELDLARRRVYRAGKPVSLTAKEFTMLTLFMRRRGTVLSRYVLAEQVWDINFNNNTNVVEIAVRRLREKIDGAFERKLLHTVRGMGYVLEDRDHKS